MLLAANHISWWDGFLLRDLRRSVAPAATHFTLMHERELARHPFLRRLGAVPVASRAGAIRSALHLLQASRRDDPHLWISWFPQGQIRPSWRRPLGFERGIEWLSRKLAPCLVVPVALQILPRNRIRPTAVVLAGEPVPDADVTSRGLEERVTALLDRLQQESD